MSKAKLVDHLLETQSGKGLTRKAAQEMVDTMFLHIRMTILRRKEFRCSKFGQFHVIKRKKTKIQHPATGEILEVPSKKTVSFYASPVWTKKLNQ